MHDGLISMQFSRDFPPGLMLYLCTDLRVREATIAPKETRRNGDRKFEITIPQTNYSYARLMVTLFNGTDDCFIQIREGWGYGEKETGARGRVSPLSD